MPVVNWSKKPAKKWLAARIFCRKAEKGSGHRKNMNKTILSILAGLGGMFGWGTSDFFASLGADKIGHFKTFFWSQLIGMIFIMLFIPFFALNINISFTIFLLLVVSSIFYAVAYLFFYKAFEIGNVSIIMTTINLDPVSAMVIAFIFLGQRLSSWQFIGVLMIIAGVTLVSLKIQDLKNKKFRLLSGVKETLIAAILFGIYWNLSEIATEQIGWLSFTLFVKVGAILFLLLFSFFAKRKLEIVKISTKTKLILALVGILEAAGVTSVNYGMAVGDVILVAPISSALSVVTIGLAIIFLKEKITRMQGFGMFMVLVGIVFTTF
jgi:drug/metabolite transporter (DMT)-like permease